jgi:hypothetical protein
MANKDPISLSARGEFLSYNKRFFYGTVAKVLDTDITIKGTVGKGRRKKVKYYTFPKDRVEIYERSKKCLNDD